MRLLPAIAVFGASAITMRLSVYELQPAVLGLGWPPLVAFLVSYCLPLAAFTAAALVGMRWEGRRLDLPGVRHRLRLHRLSWRDWRWISIAFLTGFIGSGLLAPTATLIASTPGFGAPSFFPDILDPLAAKTSGTWLGVQLAGAWWILPVWLIFLVAFNMIGEEVWFRGYLLPRQERAHGSKAWIVHGLLWGAFHVPVYPWYALFILPTALSVAFVAQRQANTTASLIVHLLGNGITVFVPLVVGVAAS